MIKERIFKSNNRMKRILNFLLLSSVILFLSISCQKDNDEDLLPIAALLASRSTNSTVTDEAFGNALSFDGVGKSAPNVPHVAIGVMSEMRNASAFTIEMWLNFESGTTVLGTKETSDANKIDIERSGTNNLIFFQANGGTGYRDSNGANFPFNQWAHVAVVFDGSQTGFNRLKIYRNGTEVTTTTNVGTIGATTSATLGPVTLGAQPGSTPPTTSGFGFNGKIDDLRIWSVARTQPEIESNYRTPLRNPASETNLISYYKFNASSGTTLVDEKGKYNGTLRNMNDSNWVSSNAGSN
jgi:hypothetical protein